MDDETFAKAVRTATKQARELYGVEAACPEHRRSALVRRLKQLAPIVLKAASEASDGFVRYDTGIFGSYNNERYSLWLRRPDGSGCSLHVIFVGDERVHAQIRDGVEVASGLLQWLTLEDLREPQELLQRMVLALIDQYARACFSNGVRY